MVVTPRMKFGVYRGYWSVDPVIKFWSCYDPSLFESLFYRKFKAWNDSALVVKSPGMSLKVKSQEALLKCCCASNLIPPVWRACKQVQPRCGIVSTEAKR